ncbi:MAG: tRNA uridine-5-carboxymethylaminomethyl(34) synthesis GTPase MnmE [Bdellovibrionales bacterium]|nr:tRNA uridine-5-carboxymethylaminomethyl(34) synthesis GTPase MnmE [Bdellovibrionales bacterium]
MTGLLSRDKDTICALASAPGQAGISVVRVSGPQAISICRKVCSFLPAKLETHRIYYGHLKDPRVNDKVDEVLVSYFEEGRGFTGEDSFEISLHGNPRLVDRCLEVLIDAGARQAERGEFTFRAFINGRVDLVQAESVLDLIQSQSRKAAGLSLRQLEGQLSKSLFKMKERLTFILAHLEANIDFASEDIQVAEMRDLESQLSEVISEIQKLLSGYRSGQILKSGFKVVLVGRPNVGKSSLLNGLLQEEKAIVTSIEGTTRDLIEGQFLFGGYLVDLTDTAGQRDSVDEIELIGQKRAREKMASADLILVVLDGSVESQDPEFNLTEGLDPTKVLVVVNKMDLPQKLSLDFWSDFDRVEVSSKTGSGLEELKTKILSRILSEMPSEESVVSLNARHFNHLKQAEKLLGDSLQLMIQDESPDLIALDLHGALREVYEILGEVYDDQVMDQVFNQFCIGK